MPENETEENEEQNLNSQELEQLFEAELKQLQGMVREECFEPFTLAVTRIMGILLDHGEQCVVEAKQAAREALERSKQSKKQVKKQVKNRMSGIDPLDD